MRIAIVTVPYITNDILLDYAIQSLESFKSGSHNLYNIAVVNKWRDSDAIKLDKYYDHVIHNDKNILARAWNKGINYALGRKFDYVVVPNLDVLAHPLLFDRLVATAQRLPDGVIWCATQAYNINIPLPASTVSEHLQTYSFSFYMVNNRLFDQIGLFNEIFEPCYFEDWAMKLRIKSKGAKIYRSEDALFFHYGNRTRESDPAIMQNVNECFAKNQLIYERMEKEIMRGS